jgi:pSer/pThr/pTyr-binding forkhead associated (FHA) protein
MWLLRAEAEGDKPQLTLRLPPGHARTVGRARSADFILDAALVSRHHCALEVSHQGELRVIDLGSTNGTYVNGRRVENAALKAGDRVGIGRVEFLVIEGTETEPPAGSEAPKAGAEG